MAAELHDAGLEADPRAGRVALEDQRDGALPEHIGSERIALHPGRSLDQGHELVGG